MNDKTFRSYVFFKNKLHILQHTIMENYKMKLI